jgi:DNA-binding transcriptional regulator YhcF (GntR family)
MGNRKAEALAASLREQIVSGRLQPGQHALSTRGLAAELGVSRDTVAMAASQLRGEGLIDADERDAWRVADFVQNGVVSAVRTKLHLKQHTRGAGEMVKELLDIRHPLARKAIAQLLTSKDDNPWPLTPHLTMLKGCQLDGYPSLARVLIAEEWAWACVIAGQLGEVEVPLAHFVRRCLIDVLRGQTVRCSAPQSYDEWMELEAAIVAKEYAKALRLTDKLLTDREPLWQLLATAPKAEEATAH